MTLPRGGAIGSTTFDPRSDRERHAKRIRHHPLDRAHGFP